MYVSIGEIAMVNIVGWMVAYRKQTLGQRCSLSMVRGIPLKVQKVNFIL